MDKENLQTKLEVLQANAEAKQEELTEILQRLNVARDELANAGKPKLSQDTLVVLVEKLQDIFQDACEGVDTSDLSPEFSIGYDNTIELDCLDMSAIEVHSGDIEAVLEQVFNIVSDNS